MVAPVRPVDEKVLQPILDVHANSIAIMPYAFCSVDNPVLVYNKKRQWWGETDEGVIETIQMAHKKNLSVMLKPHLWIGRGMYTGNFKLASDEQWKMWENSYKKYILYYAMIADSLNVSMLCIGTELGTAIKERHHFWNSLIDTIKQVYNGKLTYAANWDDYKQFPFWEKLDYIGVDAYFPLVADKVPKITSLKKAWVKHADALQNLSVAHKRPIMFTEYGYRNVDYAGAEPWKEAEGAQNDAAQSNAYEALYQSFAGKEWFVGGYVWKWYVDTNRRLRRTIDYTPQGKPAMKVIKKWYGS